MSGKPLEINSFVHFSGSKQRWLKLYTYKHYQDRFANVCIAGLATPCQTGSGSVRWTDTKEKSHLFIFAVSWLFTQPLKGLGAFVGLVAWFSCLSTNEGSSFLPTDNRGCGWARRIHWKAPIHRQITLFVRSQDKIKGLFGAIPSPACRRRFYLC